MRMRSTIVFKGRTAAGAFVVVDHLVVLVFDVAAAEVVVEVGHFAVLVGEVVATAAGPLDIGYLP
jgi:hypothetical protein